jgi:hypothetical protein
VKQIVEKPTFTADQIVSSGEAAKNFGLLRKKAKEAPQFVTNNGLVDSVLLDYKYYEQMYARLKELEAMIESRVLQERIDQLETNPAAGVSCVQAIT